MEADKFGLGAIDKVDVALSKGSMGVRGFLLLENVQSYSHSPTCSAINPPSVMSSSIYILLIIIFNYQSSTFVVILKSDLAIWREES